jgi:hypothetical protein
VPTGDRADVNAWATSVEVIGYLSEADARIAAQEMVTRESWHLHAVFECGACGFQRQVGQAMNTIAGKS